MLIIKCLKRMHTLTIHPRVLRACLFSSLLLCFASAEAVDAPQNTPSKVSHQVKKSVKQKATSTNSMTKRKKAIAVTTPVKSERAVNHTAINGPAVNQSHAGIIEKLQTIIQKFTPTASVGFVLMDGQTGRVLLAQNGDQLFTPASNTKYFVSMAALYYFDHDFVYRTQLLAPERASETQELAGNLVVKFSGDPSLKSHDLTGLFNQLAKQGIQKIHGDILIDDSDFESSMRPDGYSLDDVSWYYAAPVSAIILDGNSVNVRIRAGEKLGEPVKGSALMRDDWLEVNSKATTVSMADYESVCDLSIRVNKYNQVNLSGCWPIEQKQGVKGVALENPFLRAKQVIETALNTYQIAHQGRIIRGKVPAHYNVIAEHQSMPLPELITFLMKESDNLYADAILKTLGKHVYDRGSFTAGAHAVSKILAKQTGVNFKKIQVKDGSGSRYNLISPVSMSKLLFAALHSDQIKAPLMHSLPIAQHDGTLAWRFAGLKLPGKLIAKTGTMHDISALSGYFWTESGKPYVFSIMFNHVIGDIRRAKRAEERLALAFMQQAT